MHKNIENTFLIKTVISVYLNNILFHVYKNKKLQSSKQFLMHVY